MVVNLQILYNRHVHVPTCSTVAKLITGNQLAILHTLEWILMDACWLDNACNEYVFFFKQRKNSSIWNGKHFWYTTKKNSDLKKRNFVFCICFTIKQFLTGKKNLYSANFPLHLFFLFLCTSCLSWVNSKKKINKFAF